MNKRDTILSFPGLSLMLTLSAGISAEAGSYWNEVANLFYDVSSDMTDLSEDATAFSKGNLSKSALMNNSRSYREKDFGQLGKIIGLESKSPNDNFHTKIVGVIANWYLATQLWEHGLEEWKTEKIQAATQVMQMITDKTTRLRDKIKQSQ